MSIASLLKNPNLIYRIANFDLGQDSAVVGISPAKELLVNPQGLQDPRGQWKVRYSDGYIIQHISIAGSVSVGTLYANANGDKKEVYLGLDVQEFNVLLGPPRGEDFFVLIQDKNSGLVWELIELGDSSEEPQIALRPLNYGPKQLWAFYTPPDSTL